VHATHASRGDSARWLHSRRPLLRELTDRQSVCQHKCRATGGRGERVRLQGGAWALSYGVRLRSAPPSDSPRRTAQGLSDDFEQRPLDRSAGPGWNCSLPRREPPTHPPRGQQQLAFAMLALVSLGAAAERGPGVDHSHTTQHSVPVGGQPLPARDLPPTGHRKSFPIGASCAIVFLFQALPGWRNGTTR
jgi:hypothetical protein